MTQVEHDAPRAPVTLPEPMIRGTQSARGIEDVMRTRNPDHEHLFHPGQKTIGHFYLPPFQRPAVWSDAQSARLIESIHLGISIGSIVVSGCRNVEKVVEDGVTVERFPIDSDWLIDGFQRLNAIRRYMDDDLAVFDGTPHEHRWSDLSPVQRRRFGNTNFGFITLGETDVEGLKLIYDLMNFGGTAHTQDQRATVQAAG